MRIPAAFGLTFVAFAAGLVLGTQVTLAAYAAGSDPYAGLETFARAMTQIQANHVEAHDNQTLVWAAIDGMASALDEHTMFFDPDAYQDLLDDHESRYFGVGIEALPAKGGGALVTSVVDKSPAELAGIMIDDLIVAVGGQDALEWDFQRIVSSIKGERGTEVELGLVRGQEVLSIVVVRDEIHNRSARGELVAPGIAYVRLDQFRRGVADQLSDLLDELEEGGELTGLVLDVRDNPGGLLEEAVAVVDLFVGDVLVVSTRGRKAGADEDLRGARGGRDQQTLRIVVLIDENSASAAEIVAGALQDLDRATLVGTQSYGKGSVQSVYEYDDGSALKLTVSRYELPSGRLLEETGGLVPDQLLERAEGDHLRFHESVIDRVDHDTQLRGALELVQSDR